VGGSGRGATGVCAVGGTPAGWAGWRKRSGRRRVARAGAAPGRPPAPAVRIGVAAGAVAAGALAGEAGVGPDAAADALLLPAAPRVRAVAVRLPGVEARLAGAGRLVAAGARFVAVEDGFAGRLAPGATARSTAEPSARAGAARLSLRRWGRRRGSAPRTSDGRSSLKGYMMAYPAHRRSTGWPIMSSRPWS
jgi:hypothetical protein